MKHAYNITFALTLVGLFFFVGYKMPTAPQTAFVLNAKLYQDFDMQKELESKYKQRASQHKATLDSMALNLEFTVKQLQSVENPDQQSIVRYQQMERTYLQLEQRFQEADQQLSSDYYDQIWTQINDYVKAYGADHNYQYIYGANGDGAIMYAEQGSDITEALTTYINQRYSGK